MKKFIGLALTAFGLQSAWGFALLGPLPTDAGGEPWQVPILGYGLAYLSYNGSLPGNPVWLGDIGGPHNIGEEYRRNVPVIYYACDANFLGFFGTDGLAAVDSAFGVMNSLTNVDSYSTDLSEFPLTSQHFNYQAQSLYLTDLKSVTMHLIVEQMGLAEPERYTWTLHERFAPSGCPLTTEYIVVQRNFDIIDSPLNQVQYSPYVNNVLYTYSIAEDCDTHPPVWSAITIPFAVDPTMEQYTAVAANDFETEPVQLGGLQIGGFYTGLTRDDMAGLRYLLTTNNYNTENVAAGSLLVVTNLSSPQLITTLPLGPFLLQSQTLDPAALQALYPGLIISTTTTNYTFVTATNITPYYTNQPGPATTNYTTPILWTNYDLATFNAFALTNPPAAVVAAYPGLDIISSSFYYTNIPIPNVVSFLEPWIGGPAGSVRIVIETNGYSPNILTYYDYTFGNMLTNSFYPSNKVSVVTTWFTNLIGAPYTDPLVMVSTTNSSWVPTPSGDFFIVPTNWCGYQVLSVLWTNKDAVTNFVPITTTNGTTTVTNGSTSFIVSQYDLWTYTNRIYAIQPGVCEPVLQFATNIAGTIVTNYGETFANVVTNSFFTNSLVTILTTNIGPCAGGLTNTLCTNITEVTFLTNTPSGDFWIVPAAWNCGYDILSVPFTNVVGSTNTIITATIPPEVADIGQQYSVTLISYYTNHSLLIQPILCQTVPAPAELFQGIGRIRFVRADFDSLLGQFFQPITNNYQMLFVTNSQVHSETLQRITTQPDILLTASDLAAGPGGVPFNGTVTRSIIYDSSQVLNGLRGPGVINSPVAFDYNKVGTSFWNGLFPDTNSFAFPSAVNETTQMPSTAWASFDATTNEPVVYPNGISIRNLENLVLIQITPASLADGTNGVAYSPVTFTTTGGAFTPPYTWSATGLPAVPSSGLPPGMAVSSGGTLAGTPTEAGTFDFLLQMTDSLSRSVQWYYSITIQPTP